jgi:RNA polymerase sigma factor (sigma-70 family)
MTARRDGAPSPRRDGRRVARRPSHPRHDLRDLLAAAAAGDQRAWTALVTRFDAMVRATARRHHLQPTECDDVAQRVWIRLLRHVGSLRDPAALPGWLATVARNESLRTLAARQELPAGANAGEDAVQPDASHDAVVAAERRAALRAAIDQLPDHQRVLMRLLTQDPPPSYDAVSAVLGVPRGSIGPTRQRSLARLRRDPHLARSLGIPPAA